MTAWRGIPHGTLCTRTRAGNLHHMGMTDDEVKRLCVLCFCARTAMQRQGDVLRAAGRSYCCARPALPGFFLVSPCLAPSTPPAAREVLVTSKGMSTLQVPSRAAAVWQRRERSPKRRRDTRRDDGTEAGGCSRGHSLRGGATVSLLVSTIISKRDQSTFTPIFIIVCCAFAILCW